MTVTHFDEVAAVPEQHLCSYPRSGKVLVPAFNLVFRPEPLDFWDGEE